VWAAHAAGNEAAVTRALCAPRAYAQLLDQLTVHIPFWRLNWEPVQAMFLLEIVRCGVVEPRSMVDASGRTNYFHDHLTLARDFMRQRPHPPGERPDRDAFEVRWHQAVLAWLQQGLLADLAQRYIGPLRSRITTTRDAVTGTGPLLVDPRLELSAAMIADQFTLPGDVARLMVLPQSAMRIEWMNALLQRRVDAALEAYDLALAVADTRSEAAVRKAFLLYRLGRNHDAVELLREASQTGEPNDAIVAYWRQLFFGLALQDLGRTKEAIESYKLASTLRPAAQSPRVALAALHQLADERAEALHWVTSVAALGGTGEDPWWIYWFGDGRSAVDQLASLRRGVW
jgi:tetratricopeptide (TPR) repeat protein